MYTASVLIFYTTMTKLTPAQQQYMDMKKQHPDCLLLFRLGDFYELFYEDAHIASKVLGITLTARDKSAQTPIPMAGIPYHALEKYLPTLVQAWYKVAIADQFGDVVPGKLVERKLTQIITPWSLIEQWALATYLVAIAQYSDHWALARWDVTLWVWTTRICSTREELYETLLSLAPREIICDGSVRDVPSLESRAHDHLQTVISFVPTIQDAEQWLFHTLHVSSLAWYGTALHEQVRQACASLFWYIQTIQHPLCVRRIESRQQHTFVSLDQLTIKNLEIFQWSYQWNKKYSLFGVMNQCSTSMWSRLLADLLAHPTQDLGQITYNQTNISKRYEKKKHAYDVHTLLDSLSDIPRIAQQISQKKRMIYAIRQLSEQIQHLHAHETFLEVLRMYDAPIVDQVALFAKEMVDLIQKDASDEYDRIAPGQDAEVDRLRHIDQEVDEKLLAYQQEWVAHSGVSVKIKYITNQWYFLEVTPKDIKKFEASLDQNDQHRSAIRAQTLKTGQRYLSVYLQELQTQIYTSKANLWTYHSQKSEQVFDRWQTILPAVYSYADLLAQIDLHTTMALMMHEKEWCLPHLISSWDIKIVAWRHPVVEAYLPSEEQFIPNDLLCTQEHFFHVITWPNMGGKSTYMRQQALIVLLAHAWLPVPAKTAEIPLVDWIFARVGSGDVLAKQQSTFMTEMIETASILHHATRRSFLIIDELGRGTSTSDWLALAKAITVYICQSIQAKTLFATHYHELISLEWPIACIQNWHVEVYETEHEVIFLKKICRGGADKSYGIDVAKLAWIPLSVIEIATTYLQESLWEKKPPSSRLQQASLFSWAQPDEYSLAYKKLRESYWSIDVHTITPLDALSILQEIILKLRK